MSKETYLVKGRVRFAKCNGKTVVVVDDLLEMVEAIAISIGDNSNECMVLVGFHDCLEEGKLQWEEKHKHE